MTIVCPGCGKRFDPTGGDGEVVVLAVLEEPAQLGRAEKRGVRKFDVRELAHETDGTAFRPLLPGEERHINQRVRCPDCAYHQG